METSLRRVGKQSYSAMLVAKATLPNRTPPQMLLHFVEETKVSTVFVVSNEAHGQFFALELWRIYDMQIDGKCVKRVPGGKKF